jgi:tetratricopeptide (TPR) repeat protein
LHTTCVRGQRWLFEMTQIIAAKLGPRASELGERARKSLALSLAWLSVRSRAFAALDRRLRWAVVLLLTLSSATLTWWLMRDDASATTATTEAEKSELSVQVSKLAPVVAEPEIAPVVPEVVDDTEEAPLESEGELDTSRANQLVKEGHAFRADGKLPQAEERYLEALRTQRAYPRALAALTRLEMMRSNGKGAVRWARMLVRTHPRPATHHLLLGDAFRAAGDLAAARKAWNQARKRGSRVAKNRLK